jgi:nucleoside-diphosphate-sugar epimerase
MSTPIVILGAGYTGARVAKLLADAGHQVTSLRSADFDITRPETHAAIGRTVTPGAAVLHSIPVLRTEAGYRATMPVLAPLLAGRAARVVYLSTTGVYGETPVVDSHTAVAPRHPREQLRVDEETAVLDPANGWSGLVLRPAAIYGPDRGIHISMREGKYRLVGDGSNHISRIHVDDLARIAAAALLSSITGAYPVADAEPCAAREIAAYCAQRYGLAMPLSVETLPADDTRRSNRQVNGQAILTALNLKLLYPTYREGLPEPAQLPEKADHIF